MNVMLDTCVVLDLLQNREPFAEDAISLFHLAAAGRFDGFITAKSMADLYYLLHRSLHDDRSTREVLQQLLSLVGVVDSAAVDARNALFSTMSDYEDAMLAEASKRLKMCYVVTRNVPDFARSPVPAILPAEFIKALES